MAEDNTQMPLTSFTPELHPETAEVSYSFRCPGPGGFQCTLTDMVFVVDKEAELRYKMVQWDEDELQTAGKTVAGPLFNIQCPEEAICELHLPHCEIKDGSSSKDLLSVVHISDEGMSVLRLHKTTETHVIVRVPPLSSIGLVWAVDKIWRFWSNMKPIRGKVFLFLRQPNLHTRRQNFGVHFVPANVPLEEVKARHRGTFHVAAPPECKFMIDENYSVLCPNTYKVQPEKGSFIMDYGPNFHMAFEIRLFMNTDKVTITIQDRQNAVVWEQEVDLTGVDWATVKREEQPYGV